jgi:uncharacterized membrane protein YeaQ/YmgE (transglycosylase-associated protein family)
MKTPLQPALVGGLVMGVLSALPIISAGNLCCCLWVIAGGVVAAYVLQQNNRGPITPGEGAMAGLLAGVIGAVVYLVVSIPVTLLVAPMQRAVVERLVESGGLPPEFRDYMTSYVGGALGIALSFFTTLIAGVVFATLGGVLGAAIFRKPSPPAPPTVIDVPPS